MSGKKGENLVLPLELSNDFEWWMGSRVLIVTWNLEKRVENCGGECDDEMDSLRHVSVASRNLL